MIFLVCGTALSQNNVCSLQMQGNLSLIRHYVPVQGIEHFEPSPVLLLDSKDAPRIGVENLGYGFLPFRFLGFGLRGLFLGRGACLFVEVFSDPLFVPVTEIREQFPEQFAFRSPVPLSD